MRPIDADEFKKVIEAWIRMHWSEAFTGDDVGSDFLEMLDEEPSCELDVKPVVHAHVVWAKPNISYQTQCCSNCHRTFISRPDETIQFCPHCGAKMDEETR